MSNNFLKNSSVTSLLMGLLAVVLIMASCQTRYDRSRQEQLDEVKDNVEKDLFSLRSDISERIKYLDQQIEIAEGELEEELSSARSDLREQRNRLDAEADKVRGATYEGWDQVVNEVSITAASVRERTLEITRRINALLEDQ
jgi:hypothetical protein